MPPVSVQYSLDEVEIAWLGLNITEGLTEGDDSITLTPGDESGWTQVPNGVGGVVQVLRPGSEGEVTFNVSRGHPLHLRLMAIHQEDLRLRNQVGTMTITHPSGLSQELQLCRIAQYPEDNYGTTAGTAAWRFIFGHLRPTIPTEQQNIIVPLVNTG